MLLGLLIVMFMTAVIGEGVDQQPLGDFGLKKFLSLSIYDCELTGAYLKGRPCASQGASLDYKSDFDTVIINSDNGVFFYNVSSLYQIDYVGSVNFSCDFSFDGWDAEPIVYATHDKGLCQCDQPGEAPCPVQLQIFVPGSNDSIASMGFGEFNEAPVSAMNGTLRGPLILGEDAESWNEDGSTSYFGCDKLSAATIAKIKQDSTSLLVLMRGNCRFQTKAELALSSGATAAIIINNEGVLTPTIGWRLDSTKPAIIVSYSDFAPILQRLRARERLIGTFGPKIGAYFVSSNTRPSMGFVAINTQAHNITSSSKKFFRFSLDVVIDKQQKLGFVLFPDGNNRILVLDAKDFANPVLLQTFDGTIGGVVEITQYIQFIIIYQNNQSIFTASDSDQKFIYYFLIAPNGALTHIGTDDLSKAFSIDQILIIEMAKPTILTVTSYSLDFWPYMQFWNTSKPGSSTFLSQINQSDVFLSSSPGGQRYEDISVQDDRFLAFGRSEGIQLYDISNISNPVLIGNLDTSSDVALPTGALSGAFHKNRKHMFVINSSSIGLIELMLVANDTTIHPQKRLLQETAARDTSGDISKTSNSTSNSNSSTTTNMSSLGVVKIRAGGTFTCALFDSQVVRCWGNNIYGQLGIGSRKSQGSRSSITQGVQLGDYASITDISTGYRHACAVLNPKGKLISAIKNITAEDAKNKLICWGWGSAGQLGYGTLDNVGDDSPPVNAGFVNFTNAEIVNVEVGMYHSCGIVRDVNNKRSVRCWGLNSNGQLGYGDIFAKINASEVTDVKFSTNSSPVALSLGAYHTCALFANGEVYCWGLSSSGQLGLGPKSGDIGSDALPSNFSAVALGAKAIQITSGNLHTCALLINGSVSCWGSDLSGQLGFSSTEDKVDTPTKLVPLPYPAISINAGNFHTCAVFNASIANGINFRCWGRGDHGQLGISAGESSNALSSSDWSQLNDFPDVIQITGGEMHTCALTVNRKVRCWGSSQDGYLGYPVNLNVGDNILITEGNEVAFDYSLISVVAGLSHTCALVEPGNVRCWGSGIDGKLGYGTVDDQGSILPASATETIQLNSLVQHLAVGFKHTCVLTVNQAVTCWGDSSHGQLGRGTRNSIGASDLPTVYGYLPLNENVTHITAGAFHNCVVLMSGRIRCWGSSFYGQIPNEDYFSKDLGDDESITSIPPLNTFVSMTIQDIQAGAFHTCVLVKQNQIGKVSCWGLAFNGRLGYGNKYQSETVLDISNNTFVDLGGHSAVQISCGFEHTCALLDNGKVMCWGSNFYGQLGYGVPEDIGDDETPGTVGYVPLEDKVAQVAAGGGHTCVRFVSGKLKCWGYGNFGQLGHGNVNSFGKLVKAIDVPLVPMVKDQNTSWVSTGMYHTCVITASELFKCWGDGSAGKLGFGNYVNVGSTNDSLDLPFLSLSCGDGVESTFEDCDDGNLVDGDGCSRYCLIEPYWICSPSPGGLTRCSKCGNYFTELLEECDDGNTQSNDGCSSECKIETGWDCAAHIYCHPICGDGLVVPTEDCDIGPEGLLPTASAKGCVKCGTVLGWNCTGQPSVCDTVCGDGVVAGAEECDPLSPISYGGCSSICQALPGWTCNTRDGCIFKYKTPDYPAWDSGSAIAMIIINMLGVIATATIMVIFFLYRTHKVIRAAHLVFCEITQLGILMGFCNVFLWIGYPTNTQCMLRPWFAAISFTMIFGPISAKTFAIWQIFSNRDLEHNLTWHRLLAHFLALLVVFVIILICWTAIDPLEPAVFDNHFSDTKLVVRCDSSHRITYVAFLFVVAGILMAYNVFLAFKTRNVVIQYNESKWIAVSIYNFVAWAVIVVVLAYALSRLPSVMFLILFLGVFFVLTSTLMLLFGSRLYVVFSEGLKGGRTNDIKLGSTTGDSSFRKPTLH